MVHNWNFFSACLSKTYNKYKYTLKINIKVHIWRLLTKLLLIIFFPTQSHTACVCVCICIKFYLVEMCMLYGLCFGCIASRWFHFIFFASASAHAQTRFSCVFYFTGSCLQSNTWRALQTLKRTTQKKMGILF